LGVILSAASEASEIVILSGARAVVILHGARAVVILSEASEIVILSGASEASAVEGRASFFALANLYFAPTKATFRASISTTRLRRSAQDDMKNERYFRSFPNVQHYNGPPLMPLNHNGTTEHQA
jgi:hypothetical protein